MVNPIVFLLPVGGLLVWLMSQKKDQPPGGGPVIDATGKVVINPNTGFPGPFTPPGQGPIIFTGGSTPPIAPPYPPPTSSGNGATPPTGVTNVQDAIARAIASNSPAIMLALADQLDAQGMTDAAANLRNIARAIQANTAIGQAATDAAGKILGGSQTSGTPITPANTSSSGTGVVPANYALAQAVAMHLNKVRKGSEDKILIANFQRQEGLKPDGLYGPATAMAFVKYRLSVPAPFYGSASTSTSVPPRGPFPPVGPPGTVPASTTIPPTKLQLAQAVAANIATSSKGKENKSIVAAFQRSEGLSADGLYGPATAARVASYGINAPAPLYGAGSAVVPVTQTSLPPGVLQLAQMVGLMLSKASKGREDRALVRQFQQSVGLTADGLYGRGTAAALGKLLGTTPPNPMY